MTVKRRLKTALVAGLFFISAGGCLLHYFVHEPAKHPYSAVPLIVAAVNFLITPWLFCARKTLHAAYLLNGFSVIIGTVTMGHYSIVKSPIVPDIFILWAKFAMGYAIFYIEMFSLDASLRPGWKTIRYPHFGFWVIHLVAFSVVYALGNLLWR